MKPIDDPTTVKEIRDVFGDVINTDTEDVVSIPTTVRGYEMRNY
jgi:hypothetical protein